MTDMDARFQEALGLVETDQLAAADAICLELLDSLPGAPMVLFLRGLIASRQGEGERAIKLVSSAVEADPGNASFHATLGAFHVEAGNGTKAVEALEKAVALNSRDIPSLRHIARLYGASGRQTDAVAVLRRIVGLAADQAGDWLALGMALEASGESAEACDAYGRAVAISPGNVGARNHLGSCQLKLGLLGDCITSFRASLDLQPEDNAASAGLFAAKQLACDWNDFAALEERVDALTQKAIAQGRSSAEDPFIHVSHCADPARNLAVARAWSQDLERSAAATEVRFEHQPHDRPDIRIGYLSSDFHDHATAHLMLGLFAAHDRSRFAVHAYSCGPDDGSDYRRRIAADCDSFTDIAGSDAADAARRIHDDAIDILVDLKGFTRHHRLDIAALRPSPVQVTWLGFPGTSGAAFFDYVVTDDIVTPSGDNVNYSEALTVMPDCYQINNDQQEIASDPLVRADVGLPEDAVVLASFNNTYKLEPVMFGVWMDILDAVPAAVLWLLVNNRLAAENLKREASAAGIDPARLVFADMMSKPRHLKRMGLADLVLDTRIYNGHTTTSDALWAGVPVLALRGTHFASRVSASILSAFGLPELIAESLDEYRRLAVAVAADSDRLAELKRKTARLRKDAPLFDTEGFARNLERGYAEMWRRYRAGEPVDDISIAGL